MKKSTIFLVAAIVVALGFSAVFYRILYEKQRFTDAAYERALGVLAASADSVEQALRSDDPAALSVDVAVACGRATEAISLLPLSTYDTLQLEAYFNRTADYVAHTPQEDNKELADYASHITNELYDALDRLRTHKSGFRDVLTPTEKSSGYRLIKKQLNDLGQELTDAVNALEEMPSLNGSYREAQALDLPEIDEKRALEIAGDGYEITGQTQGILPCYILQKEGSDMWISKNGGMLVRVVNADEVCGGECDENDIINKAREFVTTHGYDAGEFEKSGGSRRITLKDNGIVLSYCADCAKLLAFDAQSRLTMKI